MQKEESERLLKMPGMSASSEVRAQVQTASELGRSSDYDETVLRNTAI